MTTISQRLHCRIKRDFPDPGAADEVCRLVADASDLERVQAAIVLCGSGDLVRLREAVDLTRADWRDTLVGAGLNTDDWQTRLDIVLGTSSS